MDFTLMFAVLLVCFALGAIVLTLSLNPSVTNQEENRIQGTSFIPSQMFMNNDGLGGIAVNDKTLQFCLLKNPECPPRMLHISHLVGSFLVRNGEILGEGKRTGPKALISFQKIMHSHVKKLVRSSQASSSQPGNQRIDLLVLIHDEDDPLHTINFLDMETKEGGILYEKALGTANHWHNVLDGLILQADRQARLQTEPDQDGTEQPMKGQALTGRSS